MQPFISFFLIFSFLSIHSWQSCNAELVSANHDLACYNKDTINKDVIDSDRCHDVNQNQTSFKNKVAATVAKVRRWFSSPYDIQLPGLRNIKQVYDYCDQLVVINAFEFYYDVFDHTMKDIYDKDQFIATVRSFFLLLGLRWLTPIGLSDFLFARYGTKALHNLKIPFGFQPLVVGAIEGIYYYISRSIVARWYIAARLYDHIIRPLIGQKITCGGFAELAGLSVLLPWLIPYIQFNSDTSLIGLTKKIVFNRLSQFIS